MLDLYCFLRVATSEYLHVRRLDYQVSAASLGKREPNHLAKIHRHSFLLQQIGDECWIRTSIGLCKNCTPFSPSRPSSWPFTTFLSSNYES